MTGEPRREPYWTKVAPKLYVGRRVMKPGATASWSVRRYDDAAGKYEYTRLGQLADVADPERFAVACRIALLMTAKGGADVYILSVEGQSRPCKIGYSADARKRAQRLQQQMPYRTALRHVLTTPFAKEVEARSHRALAAHRARGEWFDVDARCAERVIKEAHLDVVLRGLVKRGEA
jgi:hypothetical protein